MTYSAEPARGASRVVRGTAPAATSAALAIAAHVAGGGQAPHTGMTLVATAAIALLGTTLAGRRRSAWEMFATVALSHLLLHELMLMPQQPAPTHTMLLTHVCGVVLTTILLAHAEQMMFTLASALRALLPPTPLASMAICTVCSARTTALRGAEDLDPRLRMLRAGAIARRGPPHSAE